MKKLSSEEFEEIVSVARDYLQASASGTLEEIVASALTAYDSSDPERRSAVIRSAGLLEPPGSLPTALVLLARLTRDFAEVIVQGADTCMVGRTCAKHGGAVHGREAEELRAGVERLLGNSADGDGEEHLALEELHKSLFFLLDHVDARDSLAFLEAADEASASEEKSP
jgi:hypothetical protein